MMTKRLSLIPIAFLVMIILFAAGKTRVLAADVFSLTMYDVNFVFCFGASVEGNFKVSAMDSSGAILNSTEPADYFLNFESDLGTVSGVPYSSLVDETGTFALALGVGTASYIRLYAVSADNPTVRSSTFEIRCDGTVIELGGGTTADGQAFAGVDDRINRGQGDLVNVLYPRRDAQGRPEVQVYSLNRLSQGVYEGKFAYTDFAPYLTTPPARNTLVAEVDESALYVLTTGEFQINIGPDIEGKTYVILFSGLPPRNIRFSQFNLYTMQGR